MKICPKCQQTYTDENLNFCLNDGSVLNQSSGNAALPETVFINPPPTNPNQQFGGERQTFGNQPQSDWNNPPQQQQFSMQPAPKSSKTWLWVVGILGVLALVCGGGLIGFFALVASVDKDKNDSNSYYPSPTASPTTTTKKVEKYDMSNWETGTNEYETSTYSNGALTITMIKENFFYVFVTKEDNGEDYQTQDVTTKVTVKNVNAKPARYGFGLVVHSDSTPLDEDYTFVINSEKKMYRVVEHSFKSETIINDWKYSSAIKSGTDENLLEVRDAGDKMNFYINGQFVVTIDDEKNNGSGIAGIYTSEKIPITFSNLQTEE